MVTGTEDLVGEVILTVEAPRFISCGLSPEAVWLTPGASASANLTVSAAGDAPVGEYEVVVLACAGETCSRAAVPVDIGELNVTLSQVGPRPRVGEATTLRASVEPVGPPPEFASLLVSSPCADVTPDTVTGVPPFNVELSATADLAGECVIEVSAAAGGAAWFAELAVEFLPLETFKLVDVSLPPSLPLGDDLAVRGSVTPAPGEPADLEVTLRGPRGSARVSVHEGAVDPAGLMEFTESLETPGEWVIEISLLDPRTGERIELGRYSVDVEGPLPDLTVALNATPLEVSRGGEVLISLRVLESSGLLDGAVRVSVSDGVSRAPIFSDDLMVEGGSSGEVTLTYRPAVEGVLTISATVDPDDEVSESNEYNNRASLELRVSSPVPPAGGATQSTPEPEVGGSWKDARHLTIAGIAALGAAVAVATARHRLRPVPPIPAAPADPCEGIDGIRRDLERVEERLREASLRVPEGLRGISSTDEVEGRLRGEVDARRRSIDEQIRRLREEIGSLEAERRELEGSAERARERLEAIDRRLRRLEPLRRQRDLAAQGVEEAKERLEEGLRDLRESVRRFSERLRRGYRHRGMERSVNRAEERLRRAEERLAENPRSGSRVRAVERARERLARARERLREHERLIEGRVRERERKLLEGGATRHRRRALDRARSRLERAEERLREFERRHSEEISEREDLRGKIASAESRIGEIDQELAGKRARIAELERSLSELDARRGAIRETVDAHREMARLLEEKRRIEGRIRDCEEEMEGRRQRRRDCELRLREALDRVDRLRTGLRARRSDVERAARGLESELESLEAPLDDWAGALKGFMGALRRVSSVLKLAKTDVDPTRFRGLWDWEGRLLGSLGTSAGYLAEELASGPVPTDLVKAVGGMYSIMSSILNPNTWGGGRLLMGMDLGDWDKILRAFNEFPRELEKLKGDPAKIRAAREGIEGVRGCLKGLAECLEGLHLPSSIQLPGDCESALETANQELEMLADLDRRLTDCEARLEECRAGAEEARERAKEVRSRVSSLRRMAEGLVLYRRAVCKRLNLPCE
ncbi:MAG: CARDB domain-containing protein [Candidatus Korarchaeota archaeon]|nr:CARDB domain-containing protein [Candidatus Korarchaeota archaeon]